MFGFPRRTLTLPDTSMQQLFVARVEERNPTNTLASKIHAVSLHSVIPGTAFCDPESMIA